MFSKLKSLLQNDATFLMVSTVIVNAGNYAINLLLGRFLGPEAFAEVSVIATAVLMLSFFAVGLQLTAAKYTATYYAENDESKLKSFIHWLSRKSFITSTIVALFLISISGVLKNYFHFNSIWPFIIILVSLPLYFDFSISRGLYQGTDKFKKLANTYLIEMVTRLVITFGLIIYILQADQTWTTEAIAVGFLFSFVCTYLYSRRKKGSTSPFKIEDIKSIRLFILIIVAYEFSQIMINNSDIMLVKHYFPNQEAGLYSALALIGRVVFFATWTIVTLLFPKVIQAEKKGEKHSHLFWGALAIVFTIGCIIILACLGFGSTIMSILFGSEYIDASPLLWKYACATTLFACANVFAYYYMSLDRYMPVFISLLAGLFQIIAIIQFHNSLEQVILVQISLMAILFLLMLGFHIKINMQQFKMPILASKL